MNRALLLLILAAVALCSLSTAAQAAEVKQRTIVTTDPELDDLNSLLRMLLYSNDIEIEGLVYSSSQHHYMGDPATGLAEHRWKFGPSHIEEALDAYDQVDENLRVHDPEFPTAAALRAKYRIGNIKNVGDMAESTPGSKLIADVLLDDEPGQVFLQAWGGVNTIARGLKDIEERYKGTPQWDAVYEKVSKKAVITRWGSQDNTYASYVLPNWPKIENREVSTNIWGYSTRSSILPEDAHLVAPAWTRENVSMVGPIGAAYRVWGDGKFMATNFDDEDFFGFDTTLPENSREALTARGYFIWTALQPPGAFISEGDSSNFALLITNGLRNYQHATWGGWGGRQVQNATNPHLYSPPSAATGDINPATGTRTNGYHASRWWRAVQMDFAERLKWTVTPTFAAANHEPVVSVAGGVDRIAAPGEQVTLAGAATDPDGNALAYKWYQYREAGTYPGAVTLSSLNTAASGFQVPADAKPGQTIHAILEVTDSGPRPLTRYQRVVVTVVSKTDVPGQVGGTVPATLSLTLGAPATFGAFTPGVEKEYTASTEANVISTAGDAALSVSEPGHLTNGAFSLPEPLRVELAKSSWTAPVSNEKVGVTFKQLIKANDALRTGSYSKTLTFTLSTTTP